MVLDDIAAGAEQRLRRHDMVAGPDLAHQRGGDGRHARRSGAAGLGALEGGHALLQHGDGRVREAGILEARILVQEARLALLGAVIDMALRQEQRLGGLAELRAHGAGMDEPCFRMQMRRAALET